MIATRRLQRSFADGFITEEVTDLWEPWMRQADQVLEDDALLTLIQQERAKRLKKSKTRGRPGTTAEVVLRMLLLKHVRDFSFQELTREVRANLVYREFTRIGGGKVPDDKTTGRLTRQLGPAAVIRPHTKLSDVARYIGEAGRHQFHAAIPCAGVTRAQFGIPEVGRLQLSIL